MKFRNVIVTIFVVAMIATLLVVNAYAADAPPRACVVPDDAVVTLNVKRGEVATVLALLNGRDDAVSLAAARALARAIDAQNAAMTAKYCK